MSEQTNHNEILDRLEAIEKNQKTMADILTPMARDYEAAGRLIRWGGAFVIFVSVVIGIILSIKDLVTKK